MIRSHERLRVCGLLSAAFFLSTVAGCGSTPVSVVSQSSTVPATQSADPDYWLAQPAVGEVNDADFERLWRAAEKVSRHYLFEIDRRDRRAGVLTTKPTISAQPFEPWRRELQSGQAAAESALATHRRTIRYDIKKSADRFVIEPRVLVERQALAERRVSGVLGKGYFRSSRGEETFGTRESDAGQTLSPAYWYPVGRDSELEKQLLIDLRNALADAV